MALRPIRTKHLGAGRRRGGLQFLTAPASGPFVPTTLVSDNFDRADSATTVGNPQIGPTPTAVNGVWGILGNRLYRADGTTTNQVVGWDVGVADCAVQIRLAVIDGNGGPGVCVRVADADNCLYTGTTTLVSRVAGVNSNLTTFSATFVAGDTVRVEMRGSDIRVFRQAASTGAFTQVGQVTSTLNQTSTLHGVRARSVVGGRADDLLIETVA